MAQAFRSVVGIAWLTGVLNAPWLVLIAVVNKATLLKANSNVLSVELVENGVIVNWLLGVIL